VTAGADLLTVGVIADAQLRYFVALERESRKLGHRCNATIRLV
jgi:hypothetical protein